MNALICHPFTQWIVLGGVNLISVLSDIPLRTLDALHLLIAKETQADILATADRIMIAAAKAMGLSVVRFDQRG